MAVEQPARGGLKRTLAALFLAALALRLLVFGLIAHEPRKFYTYDSDGYERRALNLLRYGQLASEAAPPLTPDLDRTPAYPLYLAAVYGLGGQRPWLAALAQLLLGALTAPLVYLLARELRLPHAAGVVAGLIVALDPVAALNANRLLTETLFTLLVVAGVLLLARHWAALAPGWAVAAALLLGLAALTRPISQLLPLALLPLWAAAGRRLGWRPALAGAAIFLAVSLALTYSWAYRNYRAAGVFTLSTISDTNLIFYRARAVLADTRGLSQDEAWAQLEAELAAGAQGRSPAQTVALQRSVALAIFREHPIPTAVMLGKGVARLLLDPGYTIVCTLLDRTSTAFECFPGKSSMNEPGLAGQAIARVGQMSALQVLALLWSAALLAGVYAGALLGAAALARERRWALLALLALLVAYFVALAAGAEANSRFRLPAMPFLAVLAGYGAHRLGAWARARSPARRAGAAPARQGQA